jgi:hypothetical protein
MPSKCAKIASCCKTAGSCRRSMFHKAGSFCARLSHAAHSASTVCCSPLEGRAVFWAMSCHIVMLERSISRLRRNVLEGPKPNVRPWHPAVSLSLSIQVHIPLEYACRAILYFMCCEAACVDLNSYVMAAAGLPAGSCQH